VASYDNISNLPFKNLQIIAFQKLSGSLNMATDLLFADGCTSESVPILRFYGWEPYCVSIGYHQKPELLDYEKLAERYVEFVRRPTGGRAIYHAEELTYSVICSRDICDHRVLYQFIHQLLADALNALNYPVEIKADDEKLAGLTHKANDFPCFTKSAQTEIQYKNKKLVGSAQKIFKHSILQHGSILIGNEHEQLVEFLKVTPQEKDILKNEIREKTTCLEDIKKVGISQEKIIKSIINQLELVRGISVNSRTLSQDEIDSAKVYINQLNESI
jgi:lipoate-protein ligase A